MKKKKLIAGICAGLSVMMLMSGCMQGSSQSDGGSKETKLKWVMGGVGQLKDSELVWDQFNQKLKEHMPNTSVEFEVIPYADFAEKWRLMSASKEEVDLVWVGWMLNLYEEAQKGSLMALDELLPLATDLTSELPEYLFDLAKVNGKIYCVPNYQIMTQLPYGVKTQAELAEKYLDAEKVTETFNTQEPLTKEDYQVFDDYLAKLKENGELRKGVSKSFLYSILGRIEGLGQFEETVVANAVIDWRDPELKVYDELTDFSDSMEYYEVAHDWYQKGYIRKDILSVQDVAADENKENGYVLWSHSVFKDDSEMMTKKYGFPILSVPTFQELYVPSTRPSSNTGISKTTKDAEASMKLLDLVNTKKGKDLYNMLVFGLEGTHYNKQSENKIEWLSSTAPGKGSDNAYGYDTWAIGNTFNAYETQFDAPDWNNYILHDVNEKAHLSPLIGFTLNTENIKLELAQYNAIMKEYDYVKLGTNSNYEELIAERNEKLKKAGSDKIVEEVRKQIEEWKQSR